MLRGLFLIRGRRPARTGEYFCRKFVGSTKQASLGYVWNSDATSEVRLGRCRRLEEARNKGLSPDSVQQICGRFVHVKERGCGI